MKKIRVLLVDDHPLFREALAAAIEAEPDLEVAGEANNGQQAVLAYLDLKPDVTVMDLYLPIKTGIEAMAEIIAQQPDACVLAITSSTEEKKVLEAIQAGAKGYLLKDVSRQQFLYALRTVADGKSFLPLEVAARLAHSIRQMDAGQPANESESLLTPRQLEILALLGEGLSNRGIADRLFISESTVRVHIFHILAKLNLEDRSQAIVYALRGASNAK